MSASRPDPRGPSTPRYTAIIAAAFGLTVLAAAGLTTLYALGGQPQIEGTLIFAMLAGLAIGFVLWGNHLMPQGPFVEEREPMESVPMSREEFAADYYESEEAIPRRRFLTRMLLAALGALGVAAIFPIRSLGPNPGRSLFRTSWTRGARVVRSDGTLVTPGDIPVGGVLTVFPEGHTDAADSQAIVVHVDPSAFRPLTGRESWSPDGLLCYSKICTHAGCPVGLYEQQSNRLFCPCHQSVFDVLDGAAPSAGPATRPLPQLPLGVDAQGYLQAQGDFNAFVGPGFWNEGSA